MNRGLNLPQIQRIMNDFERESATMDMKEEMMSDAVDDVMDDELEDEEEESDKILKQVLDEIGVGISQQVRRLRLPGLCGTSTWACPPPPPLLTLLPLTACRCTDWPGHYICTDGASTRCSCRRPCSSTWECKYRGCWRRRRKSDGRRRPTSPPGCPSPRIDTLAGKPHPAIDRHYVSFDLMRVLPSLLYCYFDT